LIVPFICVQRYLQPINSNVTGLKHADVSSPTSPLYKVHTELVIYIYIWLCIVVKMKHLIFYNKEFRHKHITVCVLHICIWYIYMYIKTVISEAWFGNFMLWPSTNCSKDSTQEWCINLCYIHIHIIFLVHCMSILYKLEWTFWRRQKVTTYAIQVGSSPCARLGLLNIWLCYWTSAHCQCNKNIYKNNVKEELYNLPVCPHTSEPVCNYLTSAVVMSRN